MQSPLHLCSLSSVAPVPGPWPGVQLPRSSPLNSLPHTPLPTVLSSNKLHKCRTEQKAFEEAFKPKA